MIHSSPCLKLQPPTLAKTPSSLSGNALSKYRTVFTHIFSNHCRSLPLPQRLVYLIPHGRIAKTHQRMIKIFQWRISSHV